MTIPATSGHTLVLYDGVCALCNGLVRFLLRRDRRDQFRFAPLQSTIAASVLHNYKLNPADLNTVYVVADYGLPSANLLTKSSATLCAAGKLGGLWRLVAVAKIVPRFLRNAVYDLVARYRYRMFGKYDTCPLPSPVDRAKFLEV